MGWGAPLGVSVYLFSYLFSLGGNKHRVIQAYAQTHTTFPNRLNYYKEAKQQNYNIIMKGKGSRKTSLKFSI